MFVLHNTVMKPTGETYSGLERAFDNFNQELFDGKLPSCLLTLQREKSSCGYFSANRFAHSTGYLAHEIAMNPSYFGIVPLVEVMQTLVHEMAHLWQFHCGTPARGRYHNGEWADKMEAIGLMPSSTGKPGGARTGDRMADYAIKGGKFLQVCEDLLAVQFRLEWYDRFPPEQAKASAQHLFVVQNVDSFSNLPAEAYQLPQISSGERARLSQLVEESVLSTGTTPKKPTREKYACSCDNAVWGRPNLKIRCEDCGQLFRQLVVAQAAN